MAWVRAVWREGRIEEEGTVPDTWLDTQKMLLYWPKVANAAKYLHDRRAPAENWSSFPIIKIKMKSGRSSYIVCVPFLKS